MNVTPQPPHTRHHAARENTRLAARIQQQISVHVQLASQSATESQLARLWPLWNTLPQSLLPEDKSSILNGGLTDRDWKHLRSLRRKFPRSEFPLSSATDATPQDQLTRAAHRQALKAAVSWTTLLKFYESTRQRHHELVRRQWVYHDADFHASGRIAIWRAFQELAVTHPRLDTSCPTLVDIAHVQDRYTAYNASLSRALAAVHRLLYKIPAIQNLPAKPLPPDQRAVGLPNPPAHLPPFLYVARLEALGLCSAERFANFMRDDFPKLGRAQRQQFYRVASEPRHRKDPYAALLVWVLDNAPIIKSFGWQANDLLKAAAGKSIERPNSIRGFIQWSSRHRLDVALKRGTTPYSDSAICRSTPLLSPPPVFGDVLKTSSPAPLSS